MTPKITDNSQKLETIVFGELQDKQKRKQCLTEIVKYTCQIKNCSKSKNLFYRIKILRYIKIFKIRDTIELSWYKCYADCSRLNPGARRKHLTIQRSWLATWLLVKHACPVHLVKRWGLQKMCTLLAAKTQRVRGASHLLATMGSFLTICQMCLLFLHLVDGCDCSTGVDSSTAHCKIQN